MARKAISENRPWKGGKNTAIPLSEIKKVAEAVRAEGGRIDFEACGHGKAVPVCRSQGSRNAYLKATGQIDYDGGYGDHTG